MVDNWCHVNQYHLHFGTLNISTSRYTSKETVAILLWTDGVLFPAEEIYPQTSNISRTLVGNKIVDHSDVVGASPVGAAPTTSSFSTEHLASVDWANPTEIPDDKHL